MIIQLITDTIYYKTISNSSIWLSSKSTKVFVSHQITDFSDTAG
jgi:hypothetical protein